MKREDVFDEIIRIGSKKGVITYNEINEMLPAEYFDSVDVEDLIELFQDMDVKIVDNNEEQILEDTNSDRNNSDPSHDLVVAYFRSMGNINLLSKEEEVELVKKIEEGRNITMEMIKEFPLTNKITATIAANEKEEAKDNFDKILKITEKAEVVLKDLSLELKDIEKELIQHDVSLKALKILIKKRNGGKEVLEELSEIDDLVVRAKQVFNKIELETGMKVSAFKIAWEKISRIIAFMLEVKNEMVTRNLRLVINISKTYVGRGLPLLDLIQEGNIGLFKSVDKFKHEKGFKFSTYATWWIRQSITRALIEQTKTIRVPVHAVEFYNRITRVFRELIQIHGREPTNKEIAKELRVTKEKVEEILTAMQDPVALQTPVGDDNTELGDFVRDEKSVSPLDDAEKKEISNYIQKVLRSYLTPQEDKVIRMRYGIGEDSDRTLEEVGRQFGITRERVRQIQDKALRKLKYPSRVAALKTLSE